MFFANFIPFTIFVKSSIFCGTFSNVETGGATGYFQLNLNEGSSNYYSSLDLSNFETTCDLTKGISYHIHSYWMNSSSLSASNAHCSASITGGHYDPNLACSASSQEASGLCNDISRTSSHGYVYNCSTSHFSSGYYSSCEVGDLSGKFGIIHPISGESKVFYQSTHYDYLPPYVTDYGGGSVLSKPWGSIVFHCKETGARLLCAKLYPSTSDCSPDSVVNTMRSWTKQSWSTATKVVVSVVSVLVIILLAVSSFILRNVFLRHKMANSAGDSTRLVSLSDSGNSLSIESTHK